MPVITETIWHGIYHTYQNAGYAKPLVIIGGAIAAVVTPFFLVADVLYAGAGLIGRCCLKAKVIEEKTAKKSEELFQKRKPASKEKTPVSQMRSMSVPSDAMPIAHLKHRFENQVLFQEVQLRDRPHPEFMGIEKLEKRHKAQIDKFEEWSKDNWGTFHIEHYDWWAFPICSRSNGEENRCSISMPEIEMLKKNPVFMARYRRGVRLVVKSFGWDLDAWGPVLHPAKGQRWTQNEVRLGKVAESLKLFGEWELFQKLHYFGQKKCQGTSFVFKEKLLL